MSVARSVVLAALLLACWTRPVCADKPVKRAETVELDPTSKEWVPQSEAAPGTPEGDLQQARKQHAQKNNNAARSSVKKWIKTHGTSDELYPEAILLECAAEIAQEDYYKAHTRLQEFLGEFGHTGYQERALTMEFVIAEEFLRGKRRKILGVPLLNAEDTGISILDDITANYPESPMSELATLTKANYYFEHGDFSFAEQEYESLVERFPRSRYTRHSRYQAAKAALASFPGVEFDDASLIEAEERFNRYLAQYPGIAEEEGVGHVLDDISQTRAAKELAIGRYYEKTGHKRAARFYYRSTVSNWPDSTAAIAAAQQIDKLGEIPEEAPPPTTGTRPPPTTGPPEGERPE